MMLMIKVWVVKGISDALSVEPTARQYPWNNKKSPKQVKIVLGVFFFFFWLISDYFKLLSRTVL